MAVAAAVCRNIWRRVLIVGRVQVVTSAPAVLLIGMNYAPETTGIAPYSSGLMAALAARQMRCRVITTFPHYPQWVHQDGSRSKAMSSDIENVRVVRRRHRLPSKPGGFQRAFSELSFGFAALTTRFGRPDAVILVSPALLSSALAFIKAKFLLRLPVALWVQDLYTLGLREIGEGKLALPERIVAAVERWLIRSVDDVVVIHERFRDTLVQEFGVAPEKVTSVRNWTHLTPTVVDARNDTRAGLGWLPKDFVVLHAGNMGVKQGLENVIEAARIAAASNSDVKFVLLGDGNQRSQLEAIGLGVSNISFLRPLSDRDFQSALSAADALLVNEKPGVSGMAVPSKLTSYFSTGLPVIASSEPGSVTESEVLLADAGLSVQSGDPKALFQAAEYLMDNPSVASEYGGNGRRFREAKLAPEVAFNTFTEVLKKLVAGR